MNLISEIVAVLHDKRQNGITAMNWLSHTAPIPLKMKSYSLSNNVQSALSRNILCLKKMLIIASFTKLFLPQITYFDIFILGVIIKIYFQPLSIKFS